LTGATGPDYIYGNSGGATIGSNVTSEWMGTSSVGGFEFGEAQVVDTTSSFGHFYVTDSVPAGASGINLTLFYGPFGGPMTAATQSAVITSGESTATVPLTMSPLVAGDVVVVLVENPGSGGNGVVNWSVGP
jgi:hypothetical protein